MGSRRTTTLALLFVIGAPLAVGAHWIYRHKIPPYVAGYHEEGEDGFVMGVRNDAPHIGKCPVFPIDNVWNTPIDKLPKDPRSDAYVDSIGPMRKLHADFNSDMHTGIPFTEIPPGTRADFVTMGYADESDPGRYPIPDDAPIEGGPRGRGDRHVIVVDQHQCILYELFEARPGKDAASGWNAESGIRMDLRSNALRHDGWTSTDAAGLPILPGLVRYEEVAGGVINHAIRFTIPHTQAAYVWPARHKASRITDTTVAPMGARFRLRADFDVSKYSAENQVILRALKKYGIILADNGGAMFISGVPDKHWDDSDLRKLGGVAAEDFEAVDESVLQVSPDSAQVKPGMANP